MSQVALEPPVIAAGAGLLGILPAGLLAKSATLVSTVARVDHMHLAMDSRVLAALAYVTAFDVELVGLS